jgi:XTP/dITP diphosphohydrolase
MNLYLATHNQHKVAEISAILPNWNIIPDDPKDVDENAPDFAGNALIKVRAIAAKHRGEWCLADDSGLAVEALGGAPGVHSARYAGPACSTPANNALLLKNLAGVTNRRAAFVCAVALVDPSGREHVVEGRCPGVVSETPAGCGGFGYDPLFVPDGFTKSFAELAPEEKNAISHRGRALAAAQKILAAKEA